MQVLPYRYQGTRSATQYCQQPAADNEVGLAAHPSSSAACRSCCCSQPASGGAAAPSPSSPVKCWPPALAPSRAQFVKAGSPPLARAMRRMSAAKRRRQLANSSLRLARLDPQSLTSGLDPSRTLRRIHRNLIDNSPTTLPRFPGSRLRTQKFFSLPPSSYYLVILVKNLLH